MAARRVALVGRARGIGGDELDALRLDPSSSAAIWISAVLMPCPSSALPVNTVMLPSASMRIQESSSGVVFEAAGERRPAAAWRQRLRVPSEKLDDQRTAGSETASRRDSVMASRGDTAVDAIGSASGVWQDFRARIASRARRTARRMRMWVPQRQRLGSMWRAQFLVGRRRLRALQQRLGAHDHPGDAVAALRRLLVDERALQGSRLGQRAQAFDAS